MKSEGNFQMESETASEIKSEIEFETASETEFETKSETEPKTEPPLELEGRSQIESEVKPEAKYPSKLRDGATVGIICPCSAMSEDKEKQCRAVLEGMGFSVKQADNLTTNYAGYMADSGEVRGHWINRMFADPEVEAIFCVRGGDGGSRAMEYLDLELIKSNPKIFVGYSDVTSMHLAFTQQCGLVTFHGPMVASNMTDQFDFETRESFFQALNADSAYEFKNPKASPLAVLKSGRAEGILTGGNLSLLSASIGTPYELDAAKKILFIEEVGESVCRMERFLYHLRNAGKLRECAGVLLGQFTNCANKDQADYTYLDLFRDALAGLDIPVLYNIQSGHDYPMMTLPLGTMCTVDTAKPGIFFAPPRR